MARPLNPAELKIDLLCNGLKTDLPPELEEESFPLSGSIAGLGSGMEMVLPSDPRDVWVNVPVAEEFTGRSPYRLEGSGARTRIRDTRNGFDYPVRLVPRPAWYGKSTSRGVPMSVIATLQGTCLAILIGERCRFWKKEEALNCKFCSTGLEAGWDHRIDIAVEDAVETAQAAREESDVSIVLLQAGYQGSGGLRKAFPYLKAIKREVGLLVGIQFNPEPDLGLYDQAVSLGADHLCFSFEFYDPEHFHRYLPGKAAVIGRRQFFSAMEYCARRMGRGRVSGQIIAGIEPLKDTLRAVEYIGYIGASPLVCVFRPLRGTELEHRAPPKYEDMLKVFRHVYETCRSRKLPVGVVPNINWSLSLQPEDTFYLARDSAIDRLYRQWIWALRLLMRPYFLRQLRRP